MRELLEEQSGGRGVRVHVGRQEIAAPHLDRIERQLPGDAIDHGLHHQRRHGMTDRAVLGHRRLVLEDDTAARLVVAEPVGAGRGAEDLAALDHAGARVHREGADRRQIVQAHGQDGAIPLHRDLGGDAVVARVDVGLERLDAVGQELHGPAQHDRQRAGGDLVGVRVDLEPERSSDVSVDHAYSMFRDAQVAGEDIVQHVRRLAGVIDGQRLVGAIVVGQHDPRLQADDRVAPGVEGVAIDGVGVRERGVDLARLHA